MGRLKVWDPVLAAFRAVEGFLTVRDEANSQSEPGAQVLRFPDGTVFPQGDGSVSIREVPTGAVCAIATRGSQSFSGSYTTQDNTWATAVKDTDGMLGIGGANPERFTCRVAGTYVFTAWFSGAAADPYLFFRKNGTQQTVTAQNAGAYMGLISEPMVLAVGDYVTLSRSGSGSVTSGAAVMWAYLLGSGNVAGLPSAHAIRTSANITLNNTSWTNVDTGLDLVIPAQAGDVLMVMASMLVGNENISLYLDAATIVSGSPVNYISQGAGGASSQGVAAWRGWDNTIRPTLGGGVFYTVVSGDIDSGNVTLRLRYRTSAGSNKTLFANADVPFHWSVVNLKGGAASRDIGYEFAYAEFTSSVAISATSAATATTVVTAPAVLCDGNAKMIVEVYAPQWYGPTAAGADIIADLYDGSTDLGLCANLRSESTARGVDTLLARRILTPTAGSHTFSLRGWVTSGSGAIVGGAGGANTMLPGYIRVTKA